MTTPSRSSNRIRIGAFAALAIGLCARPALAHHATGGDTPASLFEGLLSGLAHPVVGLDHLVFVVGLGIWAALAGLRWQAPAGFVAGTFAGCGLHLGGLDVPLSETWVLVSLVLGGAGLLLAERPNAVLLTGLLVAAGSLHGYAYGESIIGARADAIGAYLAGFGAIQLCIAEGARRLYLYAGSLEPSRAAKIGHAWGASTCAIALGLFALQLLR